MCPEYETMGVHGLKYGRKEHPWHLVMDTVQICLFFTSSLRDINTQSLVTIWADTLVFIDRAMKSQL